MKYKLPKAGDLLVWNYIYQSPRTVVPDVCLAIRIWKRSNGGQVVFIRYLDLYTFQMDEINIPLNEINLDLVLEEDV